MEIPKPATLDYQPLRAMWVNAEMALKLAPQALGERVQARLCLEMTILVITEMKIVMASEIMMRRLKHVIPERQEPAALVSARAAPRHVLMELMLEIHARAKSLRKPKRAMPDFRTKIVMLRPTKAADV